MGRQPDYTCTYFVGRFYVIFHIFGWTFCVIFLAILWYRAGYGLFDCCGLIKAVQLMVDYDDYMTFQVFRPDSPITLSPTFLFGYTPTGKLHVYNV